MHSHIHVRDESFDTTSSTLKTRGKRVQHGTPSYVCSVCYKHFARNFCLRRHMVIHTGMRPYKCDQCDKSFAQSTNLSAHKKIVHQGIRPYACDICNKRFTRRGYLENHMRTHSSKRPNVDDIHKNPLSTQNNMVTPTVIVHHEIHLHECDQCGKSYPFASHLEMHKMICH